MKNDDANVTFDQRHEYLPQQLIFYFANRYPRIFNAYDMYRMLYYTKAYFLVAKQRVIFPGDFMWDGGVFGSAESIKTLLNYGSHPLGKQDVIALTPEEQAMYSDSGHGLLIDLKKGQRSVLGNGVFYICRYDNGLLDTDRPFLNQIADRFEKANRATDEKDTLVHHYREDQLVRQTFLKTRSEAIPRTTDLELYNAFNTPEKRDELEAILGIDIDHDPVDAPTAQHGDFTTAQKFMNLVCDALAEPETSGLQAVDRALPKFDGDFKQKIFNFMAQGLIQQNTNSGIAIGQSLKNVFPNDALFGKFIDELSRLITNQTQEIEELNQLRDQHTAMRAKIEHPSR